MIVARQIKNIISKELNIDSGDIKILIPKFEKYGYISFNFHDLVINSELSVEEIKEKIKKILNINYIEKIEYINEYCNIFLDKNKYIEYFKKTFDKNYVMDSINIGNGKRVLLEHTSSTPDASPHLGRSRGTIIGDFVKKILIQTNHLVKTEYFVNDLAKQVSMIVAEYDYNKKYELREISELYKKSYDSCVNDENNEKYIEYQIKECQNGNTILKDKFAVVVKNCLDEQEKII